MKVSTQSVPTGCVGGATEVLFGQPGPTGQDYLEDLQQHSGLTGQDIPEDLQQHLARTAERESESKRE